jgi:hypothetical protein
MTILINKEEYKERLTNNIKCLTQTHLIKHILPLRGITYGNNNKTFWGKALGYYGSCKCNPKKAGCIKCKNWTNTIINKWELTRAIDNDIVGFCINTGAKNDIFVVDWDYNEDVLDVSNIFKGFCKDTNTLRVKTPSGGYHFYFKYDKSITRGIIKFNKNIDIRTNNNGCYFGLREDGEYIIENPDSCIKKCPAHILELITNEIELRQSNNILKNIEVDKSNKYKVNTLDNERYVINEDVLTDLLNFLTELQSEYLENYNKWIVITIICKKLNNPAILKAKSIWDSWSKKSKKYNYTNNRNVWDAIDIGKLDEDGRKIYTYDINYIVKCINNKLKEKYDILNDKYKAQQKKIKENKEIVGDIISEPVKCMLPNFERVYIPYLKSSELKNVKNINQKYLDDNCINSEGISLIESGLGTGKTFATNKHIIDNDKKAISLVHLISLCENQINNFNTHLKKTNNDEKKQMKSYKNMDDIGEDNSINTTINSLLNIEKKLINDYDTTITKHFDTIFIDEAHRIIHNIYTNPCLSKNRKELIKLFTRIVKEAKQVILTDGDFDMLTSNFIKSIGREYKYVKNNYKSFDNIPVQFEDNIDNVYLNMYNRVINGVYFTSSCNTSKQAVWIKELLLAWGVPENKIVLYTADNCEEITDATIDWFNKYVIYSPKIVEGVDRVSIQAEIVYQFIISNDTINAIQVKQQICRNRNIKNVMIYFSINQQDYKYKSLEQFKDDMKTQSRIYTDNIYYIDKIEYETLTNRVWDDTEQDFIYQDNDISNMYILSRYIDYTLKINMKSTLSTILTNLGFIISYNPIDNLKEYIKNQAGIKQYQNNNKYVFSNVKYQPETDTNGCIEPRDITDTKTLNFETWLNEDNAIIYDTTTDNNLIKAINMYNNNEDTDETFEGDIIYSIKRVKQRYNINTNNLFEKYYNWRTYGVISTEILKTTEYIYCSYIIIKYKNTDNKLTEESVIKNYNDYIKNMVFDNLKINTNEKKYKYYELLFNNFNNKYERRDTSQYKKKLEDINGIVNYTKITKTIANSIIKYDYKYIDKIIKNNQIPFIENINDYTQEQLREIYQKEYARSITQLYTNQTYYKWYEAVRLYILNDEILLKKIKNKHIEDNKINILNTPVQVIYEFKTLFKKYFPEINLFTLEHTDKNDYTTTKANVSVGDRENKLIPLLKISNTRAKYKFDTKEDLLKVFRIILQHIFNGFGFIDTNQKSVRVNNKPVKQNSYSIAKNMNELLRLVLLTNNITNMDEELIKLYNISSNNKYEFQDDSDDSYNSDDSDN